MRIISQFHDYYDVGMKSGYDDSLMMIRNTDFIDDIFKIDCNRYYQNYPSCKEYSHCSYEKKIIIVMGKCYPLIVLVKGGGNLIQEISYHYSYDSFMYSIKESFVKMNDYQQRSESQSFYKFFNENYGDFSEIQLIDKCPIHIINYGKYEVSVERFPNLKKPNFYKVIPPIQMYQELSMWYGNIAAPDLCPVNLSEKDRITQHGFDKQSFRKRSSKV